MTAETQEQRATCEPMTDEHAGPCGPNCLVYDYFANPPKDSIEQQHFLVAVRHSEMPVPIQWYWVMQAVAEKDAEIAALKARDTTPCPD